MLRYGLCAFPNMVSNLNIMRKSEKKKQRHDVELLIMLRHSLHGLHAFPNTVINVSIARKSEQIKQGTKNRHDGDSG